MQVKEPSGWAGRLQSVVTNVGLKVLPWVPTRAKRLLAGGRSVTIDGNTLDPTLQLMLSTQRAVGVNGFVVAVQRRHVFVGAGRVGEIDAEGVRLRRGLVNLGQFQLREREKLAAGELIGQRVNGRRVVGFNNAGTPYDAVKSMVDYDLANPK